METRHGAGDGERYWEKSRRARETFYRYTLADLLWFAFGDTTLADEEFEHFVRGIQARVAAVEPSWEPAMNQREPLPRDARAQVGQAFATLRDWARDVATQGNEPASWPRITVELYIPAAASDRDGRPRWRLRGRLADGIVWAGLKLFSEVERSLIRLCAMDGCARVYVAIKNQRYCPRHQAQAQRAAQRRAEQAFRARAKTKKTRRT